MSIGFTDLKKYGDFSTTPTIGVVCHFVYDPKLKAELPYYDRFPLCIPADPKGDDGFLGWNLHYVPQRARKVILDQLFKHMQYYNSDPRARMQASYGFLKKLSTYDVIKPCIKHYLYAHVRSRYLNISPVYYSKIIKMPTARWTKGNPYQGAK